MKRTLKIKIDADDKYCIGCDRIGSSEGVPFCRIFPNNILEKDERYYLRCQACLDAEV